MLDIVFTVFNVALSIFEPYLELSFNSGQIGKFSLLHLVPSMPILCLYLAQDYNSFESSS